MLTLDTKVKVFKALGNDTRLMIFNNILQKPYICDDNSIEKPLTKKMEKICVSAIAEDFNFSLPTISRHLKELKDANLITMTKVSNKIFIEPNMEFITEVANCFQRMTKVAEIQK
ncbi:MAG: ArsR/SmtB family transcription factor [Campylobacteraceae bacterium]